MPRERPPHIRVAGQAYTSKEGEGVLFDDSWPHEVVNDASEPRVVLIVYVPRPLPLPLPLLPRMVNNFVLWGFAAPLNGKKVTQKVERYGGDLP